MALTSRTISRATHCAALLAGAAAVIAGQYLDRKLFNRTAGTQPVIFQKYDADHPERVCFMENALVMRCALRWFDV